MRTAGLMLKVAAIASATIVVVPGCSRRPVDWVTIPGGTFQMGATDLMNPEGGGTYAIPVHSVTVPAFKIGRTQATARQYAACVGAGSCTAPISAPICKPPGDEHPVVCVDWYQAKAFCGWAGGRLCSESEWEYAARNGSAGNLYPWGDRAPTCDDAVFGQADGSCAVTTTAPVCSKPAGNNVWGVCDLAGNVWEWIDDCYQDSYSGAPADGTSRQSCTAPYDGAHRVYRNCGFGTGAYLLRASHRYPYPPGSHQYDFGIRCCTSEG